MHHRTESVREGKLRAACDRCHDLKNRCVRSGGPDGRCDRCERLDIDCVYRNTSRIGRPREQRRASIASQSRTPRRQSFRIDTLETHQEQNPVAQNFDQPRTGTRGNMTLLETPATDAMSLLVSSDVAQQADMSWNIDFSPTLTGCISDPLYQDMTRMMPISPEATAVPDSGSPSATEQTTEKLLQLQGQLHRLLTATDRELAADLVEEALEIVKTFLDILQATLAGREQRSSEWSAKSTAESRPMRRNTVASDWQSTGGGVSTRPATSSDDISVAATVDRHSSARMVDYITAQQALTCYSFTLLVLDRITGGFATEHSSAVDPVASEPLPAALSVGGFTLASQPALSVEVLLHLMLRMVQRLGVSIQLLVLDCKDPTNRSPPSSSSGTLVDSLSQTGPAAVNPVSTPITATFFSVADLVGERERMLIERLSRLTGHRHH